MSHLVQRVMDSRLDWLACGSSVGSFSFCCRTSRGCDTCNIWLKKLICLVPILMFSISHFRSFQETKTFTNEISYKTIRRSPWMTRYRRKERFLNFRKQIKFSRNMIWMVRLVSIKVCYRNRLRSTNPQVGTYFLRLRPCCRPLWQSRASWLLPWWLGNIPIGLKLVGFCCLVSFC